MSTDGALELVVRQTAEEPGRPAPTGQTERPASPVSIYLERLHQRYAPVSDGEIANYIPELAKADPDWFGICVATCDGAVYETGASRRPFTIQSMSKPLTYGIVLEDNGEQSVRRRIGVEPSGEAFNSISLAPGSGTPLNPMINAGAIAAASLVRAHDGESALERILDTYSRYAARPLSVDPDVCRSETETGHRNRAIGHLLRNSGVLEDDPETALQLYFQQCSVRVDCRDLAVIAATLANGGVNPVTRERAASEETVRKVLSVMTSCGMYDFAGEWLCTVGLPAKSGVSGGILAVLPGQLGIGVFSPPLDARGNSVRGVRVCEDISRDLGLHLVQSGRRPGPAIRSTYDLARTGSKRVRSEREASILATCGARAAAFELQGEIFFSAAEEVTRRLVDACDQLDLAVLDLRRVGRVDRSVIPVFSDLVSVFAARGAQLALAGVGRHRIFVNELSVALPPGAESALVTFAELDLALEWCERTLLRVAGEHVEPPRVELRDHEILRGLSLDGLERVERILRRRRFDPGALAVRRGDVADEIFLITHGEMSVMLDLPGGERRRLATLSPGMVFGELSIMSRERRTADVRADSPVECYSISADDFDQLGVSDPAVKCLLLENLLRVVGRLARRMTDELALLASA
jgi:glutaminase